jgi:UDP-N-acetylglucosamine 2-epimerase (hydrolysing)
LTKRKRKILFITGTRADFGKLYPLIRVVDDSEDYDSHIMATGMHLLEKYGYTYVEIEDAGFENVFPCYNQSENMSNNMDSILSNSINSFGHYIKELKPDLIVIHGDRIEALAGALVGALNNIRVAHIEGGEVSGTIDESIRHSITKLSHIHLVSNRETARRVKQLGEEEFRIFEIGNPDIDVMLSNNLPSPKDVFERYNINLNKYGIFCYHSVTTELKVLRKNIQQIVKALIESNLNYIFIYPNNDEGSEIIIKELNKVHNNYNFKILKSIRFTHYLTLLKNANFIIGNSSSGIHEAPVYGVPTINIGTRQNNRAKLASIYNVSENKDEIIEVIEKIPTVLQPCFHYGKGNSADLFFKIVKKEEIFSIPIQKVFSNF